MKTSSKHRDNLSLKRKKDCRDSVETISQDCFGPKKSFNQIKDIENSFSGFRIPVLAAKWVSRQEGIVNSPLTIPLFQFISKLLTFLPSM